MLQSTVFLPQELKGYLTMKKTVVHIVKKNITKTKIRIMKVILMMIR